MINNDVPLSTVFWNMLTPVFELSQDDEFVVVIIKTPYVKVTRIKHNSLGESTWNDSLMWLTQFY